MAQIPGVVLRVPYVLDALENVEAIPFGDLIEPYVLTSVFDRVSTYVPNRFPTPPAALGFLTDVENEIDMSGVESPYYIGGALVPEGPYLEPTIGQIWPRIG